jgi:hypothetical protein
MMDTVNGLASWLRAGQARTIICKFGLESSSPHPIRIQTLACVFPSNAHIFTRCPLGFFLEWQFSPGEALVQANQTADFVSDIEPLVLLHRGLTASQVRLKSNQLSCLICVLIGLPCRPRACNVVGG